MDNEILHIIKYFIIAIVGWKLGSIERKIEELFNEISDLRKKK